MALPRSNGKTVAVTGINGYIASHIGLQLLQKGYTVHGTSRSATAEQHLLSGAFHGFDERYRHFVVPDITAAGGFDEAFRGVHGVLHTASPVDFSLTSVDAFVVPAVKATLSALEATQTGGNNLEAFVLTSSIAAVVDRFRMPTDHAYTEADWNESSEAKARENFSAPVAYGGSKTAAEHAFWKFRDENGVKFACAAINPGVVTGPPVSWPPTPAKLNETLRPLWKIFSGEAKEIPAGIGAMSYIDVRDVAALHIWCLEHPEASNGQRYIATNGKGTPQAMADILREAYPDRDLVYGQPKSDYLETTYWFPPGETSVVANKAYRALGVDRFIPFDKSILDTVKAFEAQWPQLCRNSKMTGVR